MAADSRVQPRSGRCPLGCHVLNFTLKKRMGADPTPAFLRPQLEIQTTVRRSHVQVYRRGGTGWTRGPPCGHSSGMSEPTQTIKAYGQTIRKFESPFGVAWT